MQGALPISGLRHTSQRGYIIVRMGDWLRDLTWITASFSLGGKVIYLFIVQMLTVRIAEHRQRVSHQNNSFVT